MVRNTPDNTGPTKVRPLAQASKDCYTDKPSAARYRRPGPETIPPELKKSKVLARVEMEVGSQKRRKFQRKPPIDPRSLGSSDRPNRDPANVMTFEEAITISPKVGDGVGIAG